MRRLDRILHKVLHEQWAILPSKHAVIRQLLEAHLAGLALPSFDADEEEAPAYSIIGNTAVVNIDGVILNKCSTLEALCGAFSLETFKANLRIVDADSNVENIILNISSPGGIITGVPEAADLIADIATRKSVYAYTNDCIASAAYWLASQADAIFISKSAEVGSIGVYSYLVDTSGAFAIEGLKAELFKSGEYKAAGIDGLPLTDPQKALFQADVDKSFKQFTSYVTAKRNVEPDAMQGQMFDYPDALANGLVDGQCNELDDLISLLNS